MEYITIAIQHTIYPMIMGLQLELCKDLAMKILHRSGRNTLKRDWEKTMKLSEYQREVERTTVTNIYAQESLIMASMGLAGETGEVVDLLKKHLFHGHSLEKDKVIKELGDVLWYLSALCNTLHISLEDVIEANVAKLRARYPDGFDIERSINREV